MRFGISTHLFHDQRLSLDHLAQIAAHGFEDIEIFATRTHFDYHDPAAIKQLGGWLKETGLTLHSIHAPIVDGLHGKGQWGDAISNAVGDTTKRQAAVREADVSMNIARELGANALVVHLGTPTVQGGENNRAAAFRSVEDICRLAEPVGITVALELLPNPISEAAGLVTMIERDLDFPRTGICLDFGHAFILGDVVDAIETVSEHLVTTHVHDNDGRNDDHQVPFDGRINWSMALMTMQKVGYDGTFLMELANLSTVEAVLKKAQAARARFEKLMAY